MSDWIQICSASELPAEGAAKEFSAGTHTLCVAMIDGEPLALDNVCPHRGGPLAEGTIEDGKVICPWHQWEFDLATGAATDGSGSVAAYPLRRDGDAILAKV